MTEHRHTNHLVRETSPYLRQHAHNPVDWYPWGPEALARALAEDRPILLSIGYSACHWCHVMERESFEDEGIAALMNREFVNIKVDREERPDLDQIHQGVVHILGRQGGWPLTVFLTPSGEPFFAGTYFPPEDRHGMPAFPKVLEAAAAAYRTNRDGIAETTKQLRVALEQQLASFTGVGAAPDPALAERAARTLSRYMDPIHGGFGRAPKFPNPTALTFVLRHGLLRGDPYARDLALLTLRRMAAGGIYDHLGGGFHRYAVDDRWLVPHFEKMLYDNALLIPLYLEAFQATGEPQFRRVAEETVAYVRREMLRSGGGFHGSQDADSEGEEGRFFVWTRAEVLRELGAEAGEVFCRAYDVTEGGNFEGGRCVLNAHAGPAQLAERFGETPETIEGILAGGRRALFAARQGRPRPFRDEKVLTGWNALMISAFARAAQVLEDAAALAEAEQSAAFVLKELRRDGRALAVFADGRAAIPGYLDDYAFLVQALLDLFETTFDRAHLETALDLAEAMLDLFWDEADGGFYLTGRDHERLLVRPWSAQDHAIPSGAAVAAMDLLRLHYLTGRAPFRERAERLFGVFGKAMEKNPFGFAGLLLALAFHADTPRQIVIAGDPSAEDTRDLLRAARRAFVPHRILLAARPGEDLSTLPHVGELLKGRGAPAGRATATVCHRFTCSLPVTAAADLAVLLAPVARP
ncbi:MAG TPA: thioredoxin domain-containing protein [Candidatus Methylomirabilis sp.]